MPDVGLAYHPDFLEHDTGPFHPESPARLRAITDHLKTVGLMDRLVQIPPKRADLRWIEEVHTPGHIDLVRRACPKDGIFHLDPDTPVCPRSFEVALTAAGAVIAAIDAVMAGRVRRAFCAVRPPGHHALSGRAMGFCLFNNVAIGARYAQKGHGLSRVLIVDFDVHHGNGTQAIFYDDPSVLFFSSHQYPYYPGTGGEDERGVGEGAGFTINAPLEAGAGDAEVLDAFDRILAPAVAAFRPEIILVSAGFDGHAADKLAGLAFTEEGYREMTRRIVGWAETHAGGRGVSVLEGGYNLRALAASVEAHIRGLFESYE